MIENAGIDYKELYLQMQSAVVALSKTFINDNLNMYINDHLRMYTSDYALI